MMVLILPNEVVESIIQDLREHTNNEYALRRLLKEVTEWEQLHGCAYIQEGIKEDMPQILIDAEEEKKDGII